MGKFSSEVLKKVTVESGISDIQLQTMFSKQAYTTFREQIEGKTSSKEDLEVMLKEITPLLARSVGYVTPIKNSFGDYALVANIERALTFLGMSTSATIKAAGGAYSIFSSSRSRKFSFIKPTAEKIIAIPGVCSLWAYGLTSDEDDVVVPEFIISPSAAANLLDSKGIVEYGAYADGMSEVRAFIMITFGWGTREDYNYLRKLSSLSEEEFDKEFTVFKLPRVRKNTLPELDSSECFRLMSNKFHSMYTFMENNGLDYRRLRNELFDKEVGFISKYQSKYKKDRKRNYNF